MDELAKKILTDERWSPTDRKEDIDLRYKFALNYCKGQTVLDAGCGIGYGSKLLVSEAQKVYGVDYSKDTVEFAHKNYYHSELCFSVMDVQNLAFKDKIFGSVVSIEVFEHIKYYDAFLSDIKRVLKKDGIFIMSTPNKVFEIQNRKGLSYFDQHHINLVKFGDLRKLLKSYFSSVQIYGVQKKGKFLYRFLRWLDFLNLRLILPDIRRRKIKKEIGIGKELSPFEIKKVNSWQAHTFKCFIAICKL